MRERGRPQTRRTIIGSLLDKEMEEHGYNQSSLGQLIGCSRKVINHGIVHNEMSDKYLERICREFNIHKDYFTGKIRKKKPYEGSAGDGLFVDGKLHGTISPDGEQVFDGDSYDEFIDWDDREGWEKRFADMNENGYALPTFQPFLIKQKKDALPYLRSLLKTDYMSSAWENYLYDDALLYELLDSIRESGYQLSQKKKEGK